MTVVLRPDPALPPVQAGRVIGREALRSARAASPVDLDAVKVFAAEHGLRVEEADPGRRRVVLSGSAAAMGAAFDVRLELFEHPRGSYRGHTGPIGLPAALLDAVVAVLGLDDRPQARAHFRRRRKATSKAVSYTPLQVAEAYGFPAGGGSGHAIGFVELGGGYVTGDLAT